MQPHLISRGRSGAAGREDNYFFAPEIVSFKYHRWLPCACALHHGWHFSHCRKLLREHGAAAFFHSLGDVDSGMAIQFMHLAGQEEEALVACS